MSKRERKPSGNSILRAAFVAISLLIQIGWILLRIQQLNAYSQWISALTDILSLLLVLRLYSRSSNSAGKLPWIMLILVFPVMGLSMYLLFGMMGGSGISKKFRRLRQEREKYILQDPAILHKMQLHLPSVASQSQYLSKSAGWPVWENTRADYYPEAVDAFEAMKAALNEAERFIFMEYFIVEDGTSFHEIEEILIRKAKEGVDVRLLYDDIGSIGYVNLRFARRLNQEGIRCYTFNPAIPMLNLFMNHRDHRKITVIDGKVGFTGGYNLADAYFGREEPFGKWKDTGVRLEGEAVQSLTAAFLEIWSVQSKQQEDWAPFLTEKHSLPPAGFIQPFTDNPLDDQRIAEDVYLNMISQATSRIWFMTPYLIITDEMSRTLRLAARRGVDVRIITPGIPDKKTVYAVTRSYYAGLARQGVRIFEYSPGFCHGKMCLCDGKSACVGTSNLDYRSLYHHFENNVFFADCPAVRDVEKDFENTFPQCREVTEKYRSGRGDILRTWQCILRLFAPLM